MTEGDTVGSFSLGPLIGRGGMASVYLGAHVSDGTEVAIKVLQPEIAKRGDFIEAFAHEVRAAASLNHHRITAIYDHGVVTTAEARNRPEYVGAPWLAMELVDGETLSSAAGSMSWQEYKRVVLDVLDAVGHAHARGLIHRDIKPANVLLDERTRRIKLTDFGLVHHTTMMEEQSAESEDLVSGTPAFMAPEQIQGQPNKLGPWTDLYAVGITAWALACGYTPYRGPVEQVFQQHLKGELPPFDPQLAMPLALVDWLEAMVATKPEHRFQCAADAAWMLQQIEVGSSVDMICVEQGRAGTNGDGKDIRDLSTQIHNAMTTAMDCPQVETAILSDSFDPVLDDVVTAKEQSPLTRVLPPIPEEWRTKRHPRTHLHGAGLALFSLRTTGVVGRDTERDHLWNVLRSVTERRRVECVLINGPSGSGTSTLAQWLATRAHEVGGAHCLMASHSLMTSESAGMSALLGWSLPIQGLDRADAVEKTKEHIQMLGMSDLDDAIGLVQLARPHLTSEDSHGLTTEFSNQTERLALLSRYFAAQSQKRTLILLLDKLHHAAESMALAEHLLQSGLEMPIMILGTVATEDVHEGTEMADRLDNLASRPNTSRIQLKPLETDGQVALIRELLGLDLALAATVEQRCGGNPQFAVQLVSDWVERGLLIPSDKGFVLRQGADTSIPNDMMALWRQRLDGAFAGYTEEETAAIELGAMLGTEVNRGEWEDAMSAGAIQPCARLMSELQRRRLIITEAENRGWSFVHALFHAAVVEHAEQSGRAQGWANVAAEILPAGNQSVTRRARLLVAANRTEDALQPLCAAILHETMHAEYGRARQLFAFRESLLVDYPVHERSHHALGTEVCSHFIRQHIDRYERIQRVGPGLIAWAEELEVWDVVCRLKLDLGTSFVNFGDTNKSIPYLKESLALARKHRLPIVHTILNRICFVAGATGKIEVAASYARDSIHEAEVWGDINGVGSAYMNLSRICSERGLWDLAEYHMEEARLRYERTGSRMGLADCFMKQGDFARSRRDYAVAERAYLESAARYRGCGDDNHLYAELNLAMTYLEGGKFTDAKGLLAQIRKHSNPQASKLLLWIRLCSTCCLAHEMEWSVLETELAEVQTQLQALGVYDIDAAGAAQICAHLCEAEGQDEVARMAWKMAVHQLKHLDREDEARVIEDKIGL